MNAKETLLSWIESGDTAKVLSGLAVVCKRWGHKDLASDISFHTGRFNILKGQQSKQLISHVDYQLESAKLRQALIDLISEIPKDWTNEGLENIHPIYNTFSGNVNWKKWVSITFGVIAFAVGVAEYSGYSLRNIFQSTPHQQGDIFPKDSLNKPDMQISTSGHQSPAIHAPNSDVQINYTEPETISRPIKKDSILGKSINK